MSQSPNNHTQRTTNLVILFVITLAISLRCALFLSGRELWMDESQISNYIAELDIKDLFKTINATVGFLLVQKIMTWIFGVTDYTFRLLPLLAGTSSVILMYYLARRFLSPLGTIFALILFAFSDRQIYFSSEAKQYTFDVFFSLLILLDAIGEKNNSKQAFIKTLLLWIMASWFSHASVFIIGATSVYLLLQDSKNYRKWLLLNFLFALNFLVLFSINLYELQGHKYLQSFWADRFMPFPPWENWRWFGYNSGALLRISMPILTAPYWLALWLCGLIFLGFRDWKKSLLLFLPLALCMTTSGLKLYPFTDRLLLFLGPLLMISLAGNLELLRKLIPGKYYLSLILTILLIVAACTLISLNLIKAAKNLVFDDNKQAIEILNQLSLPSDGLIVNRGIRTYQYYNKVLGTKELPSVSLQRSHKDLANLNKTLPRLPGDKSRIWVINLPSPDTFRLHKRSYTYNHYLDRQKTFSCWEELGIKRHLSLTSGLSELRLYDFSNVDQELVLKIWNCIQHKAPIQIREPDGRLKKIEW